MERIKDWIKYANLNELRAFFQDWQGFFGVSQIEMKLNIQTTRKKAFELIGRIQANKLGETQSAAVAVPKTSLLSPEQICKIAFEASAKRRKDLIEEIRSTERERTAVTKERSWLWRLFFSDDVEDEGVEKDEEVKEEEKENEESKMG